MTPFQIAALALAGPLGLIYLSNLLLLLMGKRRSFYLIESIILLGCVTVILVAFFGVK